MLGRETTYTYYNSRNITSIQDYLGTQLCTYNAFRQILTATDRMGGVTTNTYSSASILITTKAANRRTSLKLDGTNFSTYAYDVADRLSGITNVADSSTVSYVYDIADRLTSRTYPNGVNSTYEYDGMSRLTRLKETNSSATLFDRQYTYNSANQISQIVEPSLTRIFGYDNVNRLTGVTNGGAGESYAFDPVGNRTSSHRSSSYGYSPFNMLTSTQTANYNFDGNGNTVAKAEGSNFWRYIWDYENKLASASTRKQSVRYVYDALGRRVRRHIAGSKENTKFTYDGEDVLMDDDSGTLTKYLNGPGVDNKLRSSNGSNVSYFLSDHLGSTNGLTNASGAVTASNCYDSFGNATNGAFPTRYQFTGREYDNFTGLQFSRARFYDPNLGRFVSEDPIGFGGGDVNRYGYVRNHPILYRDPRGLFPNSAVLNPNVLAPLSAALSTLVAGIGIVASSPVVVGFAGFGAGYAIGYYPGQALANWKGNPFVNGPWNPIGTPIPMLPPWSPTLPKPQREYCEPMPRAIPWTRSPSIPIDPPDDRDGCTEEWARAYEWCAENMGKPDRRKGTGGHTDLQSCARGRVSQRCGGNRIDWGN